MGKSWASLFPLTPSPWVCHHTLGPLIITLDWGLGIPIPGVGLGTGKRWLLARRLAFRTSEPSTDLSAVRDLWGEICGEIDTLRLHFRRMRALRSVGTHTAPLEIFEYNNLSKGFPGFALNRGLGLGEKMSYFAPFSFSSILLLSFSLSIPLFFGDVISF